jgi:hypothetical protein
MLISVPLTYPYNVYIIYNHKSKYIRNLNQIGFLWYPNINRSSVVHVQIKKGEKYILAPQTTTLSPDGTPNYQHLHSDPPNYHFLIFWPHPSIYTVNSNRNWPKTRKYPSLNRENFKV